MDPNANLRLLRDLITENASLDRTDPRKAEIGDELAQAIEALDNWICTGGFLPDPWHLRHG